MSARRKGAREFPRRAASGGEDGDGQADVERTAGRTRGLGQRAAQLPHEHADVARSEARPLRARCRVRTDPVVRADSRMKIVHLPFQADADRALAGRKGSLIALVAISLTTTPIGTEASLCRAGGPLGLDGDRVLAEEARAEVGGDLGAVASCATNLMTQR